MEGQVRDGDAFAGSASRYYRSNTSGVYINDNFKMRSNLTLTGGVRWDYDGPLSEKYGRLTGFNSSLYAYDAATDTITGSGLEIAGITRPPLGRQQFPDEPAPVGLRPAHRHRLDAAVRN